MHYDMNAQQNTLILLIIELLNNMFSLLENAPVLPDVCAPAPERVAIGRGCRPAPDGVGIGRSCRPAPEGVGIGRKGWV